MFIRSPQSKGGSQIVLVQLIMYTLHYGYDINKKYCILSVTLHGLSVQVLWFGINIRDVQRTDLY
jgi:hypothetical protein